MCTGETRGPWRPSAALQEILSPSSRQKSAPSLMGTRPAFQGRLSMSSTEGCAPHPGPASSPVTRGHLSSTLSARLPAPALRLLRRPHLPCGHPALDLPARGPYVSNTGDFYPHPNHVPPAPPPILRWHRLLAVPQNVEVPSGPSCWEMGQGIPGKALETLWGQRARSEMTISVLSLQLTGLRELGFQEGLSLGYMGSESKWKGVSARPDGRSWCGESMAAGSRGWLSSLAV